MLNKARLAVFAANKIGAELTDFILQQPFRPEFFVTCDRDFPDYEERIATKAEAAGFSVYRKRRTEDPEILEQLRHSRIDLALLLWWPSIVKRDALGATRIGWLNLHPSYLPYNRGKHPYYWAITERTPFGATLHLIDSGVDTGPILFQREIPVTPTDTGESLYEKGERAIVSLFRDRYADICSLNFSPIPQNEQEATFHLAKQLDVHSEIHLERPYTGRELLDILRGRTFLRGKSAFFRTGGKKYSVKVIIEEVSED